MDRIIDIRLTDTIGLNPVRNGYQFAGVEQLFCEPQISYKSFAEAVAAVDVETQHGMAVWPRRRSLDDDIVFRVQIDLVAAVCIFEELKEQVREDLSQNGGIVWSRYKHEYQLNKQARQDAIAMRPDDHNR